MGARHYGKKTTILTLPRPLRKRPSSTIPTDKKLPRSRRSHLVLRQKKKATGIFSTMLEMPWSSLWHYSGLSGICIHNHHHRDGNTWLGNEKSFGTHGPLLMLSFRCLEACGVSIFILLLGCMYKRGCVI